MSFDARKRAAVLLLAVGPEAAGEALRTMGQASVTQVVRAMRELGDAALAGTLVRDVLGQFQRELRAEQGSVRVDSAGVDRVIGAGLGAGRRTQLLGELAREEAAQSPFAEFARLSPPGLALAIGPEPLQIKALVLANVPSELAGETLRHLEEDERVEVVLRVARMEEVSPEIALQVGLALGRRPLPGARAPSGGASSPLRRAASLLSGLDGSVEGADLRERVRAADAALADAIDREAFALEDIVLLPDSAVQKLLSKVEGRTLALSLKGCDEAVSTKLLQNLSKRARESVLEERELLGPQTLSAVKEAQEELLGALRELVQGGQVSVQRGGGGELVN